MSDKANLIRELKVSTGAPLAICLQAYEECSGDKDLAMVWIKRNYLPKISSSDRFYRYFCFKLSQDRFLIGALHTASEITLFSKESSDFIASIPNSSNEERLKQLEILTRSFSEEVGLSSMKEVEATEAYMHKAIDDFSCKDGVILAKGLETSLLVELHYNLPRERKGRISNIQNLELRELMISAKTIDGDKGILQILPSEEIDI